jgi:DNA-binding CsgD family transcriptional regulator
MRRFVLISQAARPSSIRFPLAPGNHVIGRSSGCEIVIPCQSVSRRHARLSVSSDHIELQDLNSSNGTFVEDRKIRNGSVRVGQAVRFGLQEFILELLKEEVDPPTRRRSKSQVVTPMPKASDLTAAQRRVYQLLLEGISEKEVAERLTISQHTVHAHVRKIYGHFGVHSRAALLAQSRMLEREGEA